METYQYSCDQCGAIAWRPSAEHTGEVCRQIETADEIRSTQRCGGVLIRRDLYPITVRIFTSFGFVDEIVFDPAEQQETSDAPL